MSLSINIDQFRFHSKDPDSMTHLKNIAMDCQSHHSQDLQKKHIHQNQVIALCILD